MAAWARDTRDCGDACAEGSCVSAAPAHAKGEHPVKDCHRSDRDNQLMA